MQHSSKAIQAETETNQLANENKVTKILSQNMTIKKDHTEFWLFKWIQGKVSGSWQPKVIHVGIFQIIYERTVL
jgi:hypothetical protein